MSEVRAGVYFCGQMGAPLDRHPCVVVIEIAGSREALVVPAFTAGRHTVESLIAFYEEKGVKRSALTVSLDNAIAIEWSTNISPSPNVEWTVFQTQRVPLAAINTGRRVGTMTPQAFQAIIRSILEFSESTPGQGRFSKPLLKKLRNLLD